MLIYRADVGTLLHSNPWEKVDKLVFMMVSDKK